MDKKLDQANTAEGLDEGENYIVICDDFHSFAGPVNEHDALVMANAMNTETPRDMVSGKRGCMYRIVAGTKASPTKQAWFFVGSEETSERAPISTLIKHLTSEGRNG